ncbi:MAG: prepilin-type N-terminal cleavage/methylation domain-containing protein [Minisyncoccia bacterium]
MYKFFKQKNKNRGGEATKGFTLVETLVAISIFTISILGLLVALSQGISDTGYAKKKILAGYLAQEAVEFTRNKRDTYVIYHATSATAGWNEFKTNLASCELAPGCYYNADNLNFTDNSQPVLDIAFQACPSGGCPELRYDSTSGQYGYTGQLSGFVRKIRYVAGANPNEVKIFSTVSWKQGSGNYDIELSELLFNWVE